MDSVTPDETSEQAVDVTAEESGEESADKPPKIGHQLGVKPRTEDIQLNEDLSFTDLGLGSLLIKGLSRSGFERPSPIQLAAIPYGRCGLDLVVQAKSGTGKTCVFSIVALEAVNTAICSPQVLMLTPTREIALQVEQVVKAIGSEIPGLVCHCSIGGLSVRDDRERVKKAHVVIGTPGRVKQLMELPALDTSSIRLLVLDEADKLLENSFQEQINWIYSGLPDSKQVIAASATYKEDIVQHLCNYMHDPTFVRLNSNDPVLLGVRQYKKEVSTGHLPNENYDNKVSALIDILSSCHFQQCLVFSNLITRAENLSKLMVSRGWPTTHIAGSQEQEDRIKAITRLKSYDCRILISTDLTSRGIDADRIDLVINLDLPFDCETYLHRVGRAGRFGANGAAITLYTQSECHKLDKMAKEIGTSIQVLPAKLSMDFIHNPTVNSEQSRTVQVETFQIFTDKRSVEQASENNPVTGVSSEVIENVAACERAPARKTLQPVSHDQVASSEGGTNASADRTVNQITVTDVDSVGETLSVLSTEPLAESPATIDLPAQESPRIAFHRPPFADLYEAVKYMSDPHSNRSMLDTTTYHKDNASKAFAPKADQESAEKTDDVGEKFSQLTIDAGNHNFLSKPCAATGKVSETKVMSQHSAQKPSPLKPVCVSKSAQTPRFRSSEVGIQVTLVNHGLVSDYEGDAQEPGTSSARPNYDCWPDREGSRPDKTEGHFKNREDRLSEKFSYEYTNNPLNLPNCDNYFRYSDEDYSHDSHQHNGYGHGHALQKTNDYYYCGEEYDKPEVYSGHSHAGGHYTRPPALAQRGGYASADTLQQALDHHYRQVYSQFSYIRRMAKKY